MMRLLVNLNSVLLCGCFAITAAAADLPLPVAEIKRTDPVDFGKEIVPILKQNCLACHHQKEAEGGLVLESLDSILKGGDSGHGVIAQDVAASLLFTRASGTEEPLMPPEDNEVGAQPLTPQELGLLKLWIEQGAQDSGTSTSESIDWQPIPDSIRTCNALDVSPDGQFAAIARGNRIAIIDLGTHQEVGRLVDPTLSVGEVADVDLIQSITFSPDGLRIASGGFRTVRLWNRTSPAAPVASSPLSTAAGAIAIKLDQSTAALVNAIGDIEIWDLTGSQRLHSLRGHQERPTQLAWAGDQDRLYSSDPSGRLIAWQPSTGKRLAEFDTKSALTQLAAAGNATHVAAIDGERKTQLFRLSDDGKTIDRVTDVVGGINDATAVAFTEKPSPMAVVASEAGGVVMVGLADNKTVRKIDHGAVVNAVAVTTDQTRLVTGGRDGKTRLWNIADGKPILSLEGDPKTRILVATASRDAARQKGAIERLNQKTGELEKLLAKETEALAKVTEAHEKAVEALASEEQKRVQAVAAVTTTETVLAKATADATKAAQMTEASTKKLAAAKSSAEKIGKEIESETTALKTAQQAAAKAQQEIAAITKRLNDAQARAAEIEKVIVEKQAAMAKASQDATEAQTQIETASKLAAAAKTTSEKATKDLEAQKKAVTAAEQAKQKSEQELTKRRQALDTSTSAQKRAAAAVPAHKAVIESETRRMQAIDKQLTAMQSLLTRSGNEVVSVAVSHDDQRIATAHQDGSLRVYRTSDGLPLRNFQSSALTARPQVGFSGSLLYRCGPSQSPAVWSTDVAWTLERTIGAVDDPATISDRVTAIDFRRDGLSLAVGSGPPSRSGEVKIFAVDNGQVVRDFGPVHSDTVLGIEFSPDGQRVASAAADKTIRILDVASGKVIRSLEGHTHHVLSIAWQDDGQTIASASADQSIKIWNTETGEQRRTIAGFPKETTAVAFVEASNQIVTACADGQIRLSDTANGKSIRTFNAGGDFLFTLSVSSDGKKLLAGGQSGVVRIWTLADGKLIHELK